MCALGVPKQAGRAGQNDRRHQWAVTENHEMTNDSRRKSECVQNNLNSLMKCAERFDNRSSFVYNEAENS